MYKPPYIAVAGRFELQVSVLTGLGAIGNYNQHAVARIVVDGRTYEVPVLTGNSLKHWHAVYLAEIYKSLGGRNLNDLCERGIGSRGYTVDSKLDNLKRASSEIEAIKDLCNDIHGFLIPREENIKRDSLVKTAFAIPVLTESNIENTSKFAVQHNKVVPPQVTRATNNDEKMMPYKQEYATSSSYGFAVRMDLGYILVPMYEQGEVDLKNTSLDEEKKLRAKSSILALFNAITGAGSKQARALPISSLREIVAVVSNMPIPNIVHGAYEDYFESYLDTLKGYVKALNSGTSSGSKESSASSIRVKVMCYGIEKCSDDQSSTVIEVKRYTSLQELLENLVSTTLSAMNQNKSNSPNR